MRLDIDKYTFFIDKSVAKIKSIGLSVVFGLNSMFAGKDPRPILGDLFNDGGVIEADTSSRIKGSSILCFGSERT